MTSGSVSYLDQQMLVDLGHGHVVFARLDRAPLDQHRCKRNLHQREERQGRVVDLRTPGGDKSLRRGRALIRGPTCTPGPRELRAAAATTPSVRPCILKTAAPEHGHPSTWTARSFSQRSRPRPKLPRSARVEMPESKPRKGEATSAQEGAARLHSTPGPGVGQLLRVVHRAGFIHLH